MADQPNNGDRPSLIMSLGEVKEKHRKVTREELDKDLTELSFGILAQYNQLAENTAKVLRAQNTAILQLEARTLRGRIRRTKAWAAAEYTLWREIIRDRLGIEPSPAIANAKAAEAEQVRRGLERADANPEAMPKP